MWGKSLVYLLIEGKYLQIFAGAVGAFEKFHNDMLALHPRTGPIVSRLWGFEFNLHPC